MTPPHAFIDALLQLSAQPGCRDSAARLTVATDHRHGLAATLLSLNAAGYGVSGPAHPNPPETCNLCSRDLASTSPFFVDGMTTRSKRETYPGLVTGEWADMCADCYLREGRWIGWGIGQLYTPEQHRDGSLVWVLVGGGDPSGQLEPTEPWE